MKITRRRALKVMAAAATATVRSRFPVARADEQDLRGGSPSYRLAFSYRQDDLIGDLLHAERGEARRQSELPHDEWYSRETRRRFGAWGPRPRQYAPLEGLEDHPLPWARQRVIAVAERFIGYGYQHHHIPDWNPPDGWPWKESCVGHNGRGVDCSNFTSFVYNQGFGIRMNSDVGRQAELRAALEGRSGDTRIRTIELPADYEDRQKTLQTGDLLYILGRPGGHVTHVVLWVGSIGRSPSDTPLVIDSHGGGVDDDEGRPIPCGIHLRPFREDSWYNRCASHAHRLFG